MKRETVTVIVGAGPAGIATSACLNVLSIPNIVLEREDCCASLWLKNSYDRLHLHLAKNFCELPHMSFPPSAPTFVPKHGFVQYLRDYISRFNVQPNFERNVESAFYDEVAKNWVVIAKNMVSGTVEEYVGKFLVVATGENSKGFIPNIPGLDNFKGSVIHSSQYKNGKQFRDKNVLVVGCGNSGMEIAYDLWDSGAQSSIVIRNPVHVLTKEIVQAGMLLLKSLPCPDVDNVALTLSKLVYGDLSKYGIHRPTKGPFEAKFETGRSPVIDVGTVERIKTGDIQVMAGISHINVNKIKFEDNKEFTFDAIIFATGYKSTVKKWLKDDGNLFNEEGMPKETCFNKWKGENGIYSVGFARAGLFGISKDAKNVADDIRQIIYEN